MPDILGRAQNLPVYLDPNDENEIALEMGDEFGKEFWGDLEAAYPRDQLPLAQAPGGRQILMGLVQATNPADLPVLLGPPIFDGWKAGTQPPLQSSFWGLLFFYAPDEGNYWLRTMKTLLRRFGKE